MGYKYQNICLETLDEFRGAFAQECTGQLVTTGSGGSAVGAVALCSPVTNGVNVRLYSLSTGATMGADTLIDPPQISCTYSASSGGSSSASIPTADIIETAWLVVGVWVTAWAFRRMASAIKNGTGIN